MHSPGSKSEIVEGSNAIDVFNYLNAVFPLSNELLEMTDFV
jgi:hypothetical protein